MANKPTVTTNWLDHSVAVIVGPQLEKWLSQTMRERDEARALAEAFREGLIMDMGHLSTELAPLPWKEESEREPGSGF